METALILYAICASAVLVSITLLREPPAPRSARAPKGRIKYVVIPSFSFHEWAHCHPNLVIFDLVADHERKAWHESIPDPLQVSLGDLADLLKWLPPESTVVVSGGDAMERLDANSESTLFRLGIDVIFLLGRSLTFR
ncbi:MAG TPA: hypothetical protein VG122_07070 [Gemmata sp.]|nr:hypothetical protein [Gemmata sp.]